MEDILWDELELVVFDVDGTLYGQSKLRKIMLLKLLLYYMSRPWKCKELLILYHFRKEREKRAGYKGQNLEEEQYQWCAKKMNIKVDAVKPVVNQWIFNTPNQYLKKCIYPGVLDFLAALKTKGIKTAVYSDYNSKLKLAHMQIKVGLEISSTDERINSFKPNPEGLNLILTAMSLTDKTKCLYIGDRYELDGICAARTGVPFLLVNESIAIKDLYHQLAAKITKGIDKNTSDD
ncbi:HAD family hydrolase [Pedobacter heparinus]|uniref:HAD family hydrolase n=1 Tax=Pedobacter heparinus TaxID=984 RepID=UPI00292D2C0F|nr:HAD family hydrolase [Pedobacter heparinus]